MVALGVFVVISSGGPSDDLMAAPDPTYAMLRIVAAGLVAACAALFAVCGLSLTSLLLSRTVTTFDADSIEPLPPPRLRSRVWGASPSMRRRGKSPRSARKIRAARDEDASPSRGAAADQWTTEVSEFKPDKPSPPRPPPVRRAWD